MLLEEEDKDKEKDVVVEDHNGHGNGWRHRAFYSCFYWLLEDE